MKRIAILGSTGSIGENTLRVAARLPEHIEVEAIAVDSNYRRALQQAEQFGIRTIAVTDETAAALCAEEAPGNVKVLCGGQGLEEISSLETVDTVVCAVVGLAGLKPVLSAVRSGTDVAIATKEVLVAAGKPVTDECRRSGARLIPVDSEHNAIFQCLQGHSDPSEGTVTAGETVKRLLLTASGGPFAESPELDFETVTVEQALNHPRWDMGRKVTIDSATLMNKGLEIMEARWLFDIPVDRIGVLLHPESIVHSLVEFVDGAMIAQMSVPDMRFAIQYALTCPGRYDSGLPELDLAALNALHFRQPDPTRFPCLQLARQAAETGGTMPAVLNAVNEVAVEAFLAERIPFPGIWKLVELVMPGHDLVIDPDIDAIMAADAWARAKARAALI